MKSISAFVLTFCAVIMTAHAGPHTFTSSDGQRTFQGTLVGYNSGSQVVTVRNQNGQTLHFNIELISEKDQQFVKNAPPQVNVSLDVRFEAQTDRTKAEKKGDTRTTNYDAGYKIKLRSYTPHDLNDVEVDYLLVYKKDDVKEKAQTHTVSGSSSAQIPANGAYDVETKTVQLVNFYKRGKVVTSGGGGGCRGGGCPKKRQQQSIATRAERSRDSLIGCIARVKVNGEVVSLTATGPNLLREYGDAFSSKY